MTFKKLLLTSLFLVNILHAENSLGININSDDVEVLASVNLNSLTNYADGTTYILDLSYLHADDNLLAVGISGQNAFQSLEGLTLAFGLKGIMADEFLAFPLTAKAVYRLPLNAMIPPTSLITSFAYAPSVLSFQDAESYTEFRVEADMEVISNIHIFTGYRNIDTEYERTDKTFNSSFYGGLKLSF
jgi:hypothetical protein